MSKIKRVLSLVTVLVVTGVAFAGCALFERDIRHYNNIVVARIGGIEQPITQKQLIDAFSSFGHRFVSEYGYSLREAYDETLQVLINREIIAKLSVERFGPLTDHEAAQARKAAFDAVESNFREIESRIREERKWSDRPGEETEVTPEPRAVFTPYEKYLIRQGGSFRINLERYRDRPAAEFVFPADDDYKEFIEFLDKGRGSELQIEQTIAIDTKTRLVRFLANSEKGLGHKYDTEPQRNAAIVREINRIREQEEKNILVRRMQDNFAQGIVGMAVEKDAQGNVIETDYEKMLRLRDGIRGPGLVSSPNFPAYEAFIAERNQAFVDDLVRRAEAEYLSTVRTAIDRFERGFDSLASFNDKILPIGALKDLYFAPRQITNQFFTVSHILIGYNDEQIARLEQIEQQFLLDRNENNRTSAIIQLRGEVEVRRRVNGIETGTPMTPTEVLTFVENYVMPNSRTKSLDRKVTDFRDCIYMFNSDPGMENPETEYVIGADLREDQSLRSQERDTMSQMVPEFTAAARELFNFNRAENRGGVRDGVDTRGTMSGLVWTSHGAHIIMYTRNIHDFIFTNSADMLETSYQQFLHATLTSYGNKTRFDVIIEGLTKPSYSQYEQQLLDVFRGENQITIFRHNYKNLTRRS